MSLSFMTLTLRATSMKIQGLAIQKDEEKLHDLSDMRQLLNHLNI
jgi:hypothetical protein